MFYTSGSAIELNDGALFGFGQTVEAYPDTLTDENDFSYVGYTEKPGKNPVFHYKTKTGKCDNQIIPTNNGLMQEFYFKNDGNSNAPIWHSLAEGNIIEKLSDGSYLVDEMYYIVPQKELDAAIKLVNFSKKKRLIAQVPVKEGKGEIKYEIIW